MSTVTQCKVGKSGLLQNFENQGDGRDKEHFMMPVLWRYIVLMTIKSSVKQHSHTICQPLFRTDSHCKYWISEASVSPTIIKGGFHPYNFMAWSQFNLNNSRSHWELFLQLLLQIHHSYETSNLGKIKQKRIKMWFILCITDADTPSLHKSFQHNPCRSYC